MKKIVLIFATILILFPATIKAKDNEYIYYKHASTETKKYIYFNDYNSDYSSATIQMTDDNKLLYSADIYSNTEFVNFIGILQAETDTDLSYIMQNGYPNKSITDDDEALTLSSDRKYYESNWMTESPPCARSK